MCAVEAEFLGLVNAEGRAAEERRRRRKRSLQNRYLITTKLSCNSASGEFFYLIPMKRYELYARKRTNEELFITPRVNSNLERGSFLNTTEKIRPIFNLTLLSL